MGRTVSPPTMPTCYSPAPEDVFPFAGMIPKLEKDPPGGHKVITRVLMRGRAERQRRWDAWSRGGVRRLRALAIQGQDVDSPLQPPEEAQTCRYLDVSPVRPFWFSDRQTVR